MKIKIDPRWRRSRQGHLIKGREQVKCLNGWEGTTWMKSHFDKLPAPARRRLANSRHDICAACMMRDAYLATGKSAADAYYATRKQPSVQEYFEVIEAIERAMDKSIDHGR
jgi:hypothetical protein